MGATRQALWLVLIFLTIFSLPASAERYDIYADARQMLQWIEDNTEYEAASIPSPMIMFLPKKEINRMWEETHGEDAESISAAYHMKTYPDGKRVGKIMLPLYYNPTRTEKRGSLMHELVHHTQYWFYAHTKVKKCQKELEKDAYLLAAKWMEEQGLDNEWYLNRYRKAAIIKSQCK